MSERKVLNKYYPPDFDPSNIPRMKLPKARQYTVRIMAPCNMKCNTCGDYIAKAKKFNARKETVQGEEYFGLKIYRFYIKCPCCMAEITFKTDLKNMDYELEHGATRNFQALRLAEMQAKKEIEAKEEEEKLNPMKMLENRTKASKREMKDLEDLEELRELSNRTVKLDSEEFLKRQEEDRQKMLEMIREKERTEDEAQLREIMQEKYRRLGIELEVSDEDDSSQDSNEPVEEAPSDVKPNVSTNPEPPNSLPQELVSAPASSSSASPAQPVKRKQLPGLVQIVKKQTISRPASEQKTLPSSIASLCQYSDSEESE